jgi:flagellar hook-length control protein FliK
MWTLAEFRRFSAVRSGRDPPVGTTDPAASAWLAVRLRCGRSIGVTSPLARALLLLAPRSKRMQPGETTAPQVTTTPLPLATGQAPAAGLLGFLDALAKALASVASADQSAEPVPAQPTQVADPGVPAADGKSVIAPAAAPQPGSSPANGSPVQAVPEPLLPDLPSATPVAPQPTGTGGDRPQPKQSVRRQTTAAAATDTPATSLAGPMAEALPIVALPTSGVPAPASPSTPEAPPPAPTPSPHVSMVDVAAKPAGTVPSQPPVRPSEQSFALPSAIVPADHQTTSDPNTPASTQTTAIDASGLNLHPFPASTEAAPTASASQTGTAPALHSAPSPATQIEPVLVSLAHSPDGAQSLTMRLQPPELGQVQVRIDRPTDASAHVDITVERPETLTLLLRDQPQLQHALDLAGVPPEGRSVTFHIAPPEAAARTNTSPTAPTPSAQTGGLAGEFSRGGQQQGSGPSRHNVEVADSADTDAGPTIAATGWMRAGLDITA